MKKLQLDTKQIHEILNRRSESVASLAKKMGVTRQCLHLSMSTKSVKLVCEITDALGFKDPLKFVNVVEKD